MNKELLKKIEELEADKRSAEQQILNWRFDEIEKQLAISEDARTEWENQARQREKSRQTSDSIRLAGLESIEKEYRKKQDSLYLITSIKLDETVRGRLESNNQLQDKLIDIIKTNNHLKKKLECEKSMENTIDEWTQVLQYHVATLIDNESTSGSSTSI